MTRSSARDLIDPAVIDTETTDPAVEPVTTHPARTALWTRDLVLAWIANFALAFVFYSLMTTMALYAVVSFTASDSEGGLAASVFIIGATVARLFAGNLADLVGRRRILLVALALFLVAALGYFAVDSLGLLLVVRAVHGVAFALGSTAAMALAQAIIPPARRAEGTGYFALSTTLATAVGPFLALQLVRGPGYDALFGASVAASVLAIAAALFLRAPAELLAPEERARLRRFHPRDMLHADVVPVAAFMLVMAVAYSGVLTFLNSFSEERGLETGASVFFVVYAAVLLVSRLVAGKIQDQRGDNLVVYPAIVAFVAGLVVLAVAQSNLVLVLAGALMGLGFGTLMAALQAIAVGRVPVQRIGVAISTHFFMIDVGFGLGPILLGLLLSETGFQTMYLVLAGVVVLGAGLYHLVHGRTARVVER